MCTPSLTRGLPAHLRGISGGKNAINRWIPNPDPLPPGITNQDQSGSLAGASRAFIINPAWTAEAERRTNRMQKQMAVAAAPTSTPMTPPPPPPATSQADPGGTGGNRRRTSGSPGSRSSLVIPVDIGGAGGGRGLSIPT